jgi:hypothetical protein
MTQIKTANHFQLSVWLAFVLFASLTVPAQSGRRAERSPASTTHPTPVATATPPPPAERGENASALTVGGELIHAATYYRSNDLDLALKECVFWLKQSGVQRAEKAGKMDFNEAKQRARAESDTHLLWISFVAKTDGLGRMYIDYADYAVLIPKTAVRLTYGRLQPGQANVVGTGGAVLTIPSARTSRATMLSSMKGIAREIAGTLAHGGWLKK